MDLTSFAIVGAAAALWGQIRASLERFRALFVVRLKLVGEVATAVHSYLYRHGRVLRWGDRQIRSSSAWVRPLGRVAEVAFESLPPHPLIALLHGRPVVFEGDRGSGMNENSVTNSEVLTISAIRGTIDFDALTKAALDDALHRKTTGKRYFVRRIGGRAPIAFQGSGVSAPHSPPSSAPEPMASPGLRYLHWAESEIGAELPANPFGALALDGESDNARRDFQRWLDLKSWYRERGIPWRRGFLFYGPPGTGKTSLARALAQEADLPVFAFDLSTLSNAELCHEWLQMQEQAPCMALIEDIDGVFHGRTNVLGERGAGLTFDCLLNCLGGIQTADGVFVVITTNRPETLDEALGRPAGDEGTNSTTRPGRIDRAFRLPLPGFAQRSAILSRVLGAERQEEVRRLVDQTEGMTAAQVTEFAIERALAATWEPTSIQPQQAA